MQAVQWEDADSTEGSLDGKLGYKFFSLISERKLFFKGERKSNKEECLLTRRLPDQNQPGIRVAKPHRKMQENVSSLKPTFSFYRAKVY